MNILLNMKQAKLLSDGVSLCFLLIHIAMFALFNAYGVVPMARFNIFSMIFYFTLPVLVHFEMLRTYAVLVYLEVVAHMTCAVCYVGWGAGFQVSLIGMSILAFFAEYVERSLRVRHVHGLGLCIVGMCAYVFSFEYVHYHPAPYALPADVEFWLQVAWGLIVFVITVSFLQVFVLVTFESESLMSVQLAHDKLTGLPNRYYIADYLHGLEAGEGLAGHWLAVIDIDDFKLVNDNYGHNCGDQVLRDLSEIFDEGRGDAELCRWGGEEFLLIGRVDGGMDAQVERLGRMCSNIENHAFWYGEDRLRLTVTIGVSEYEEGLSIHEWINHADKKLYAGKCRGKNQVVA